ncbi:MAG: GSU2403 family nucleotidyltransferase fold protein [Candidatus Omnitrophota bacterium]|nr:GSU2403 family nucleotidyltransferase fold protein [Candidatus Omnitrophota bacterium]
MENSQYKLFIEVLKRINKVGVLKNIVLIGSWCIPLYKEYFLGTSYVTSITTRDVDLLVPLPLNIKVKVDIENLLKDLGFVLGFSGPQGYMKLEHPDLSLEFLVPERGAGLNKPFKLPQLGLNAQSLRYLNLLTTKIINVEVNGFKINLPHPAVFALHKLVISKERKNKDKGEKDQEAAIRIIRALLDKGEADKLKFFFMSFTPKLRKVIINILRNMGEIDLIDVFERS